MTGFAPSALAAASALVREAVETRVWPGAVFAVGRGDDEPYVEALGWAEDGPHGRRPMGIETVFDLASLTKVLVTAPAVLQAVDRGEVGLDEPLAAYAPGVDPRPTVRQALTHTTGLPAHERFAVSDSASLLQAAAKVPLEAEPGTRVAYSDIGFILLGGVVEAVTRRPLTAVAADVLTPLGSRARYLPPDSWRERIAATEVVDGVTTRGTVHDENAAAAGGVAGHAGLFGTLDDVRAVVPAWLSDGSLLSAPLRAEALRDQTPTLDGHRGLGWTARHDRFDILTDGWGPAAVSHTGFTGTSLALDPATGRWAVLLTNAVHFGRARQEARDARRAFHAALVTSSPSAPGGQP